MSRWLWRKCWDQHHQLGLEAPGSFSDKEKCHVKTVARGKYDTVRREMRQRASKEVKDRSKEFNYFYIKKRSNRKKEIKKRRKCTTQYPSVPMPAFPVESSFPPPAQFLILEE